MRLIKYTLAFLLFALVPALVLAQSPAVSVRAIGFQGLKEKGRTDPRLAPFEGTLKSKLPFDSFRSTGQSSASVARGGSGSVSAGGATVKIEVDPDGTVRAEFKGASVHLPAVFITSETTGVIVIRG